MAPHPPIPEADVQLGWGLHGVRRLAPRSDAVVIVDVLSFTTSVDIVTSRGARARPCVFRDERARAEAERHDALLAGANAAGYALAPATLVGIEPGTRLVLPSPNGSTLSLETGPTPTFAGCLRNATAVGQAARALGDGVAVIASGERWSDGSIRFALEDWLGAGAILAAVGGHRSPEAEAAVGAWQAAAEDVEAVLRRTPSGLEKLEQGKGEDVRLAAAVDASTAVPRLVDGWYVAEEGR